jgi:hypothetical protein
MLEDSMPEAPGWVKDIFGQVKMIKDAPVPYLVSLLVASLVMWRLVDWHYEARIDNRESAIRALQIEVDQFKEVLNVTSPKQAAMLLSTLEKKIEAMQAASGPRHIKEDKFRILVDGLKAIKDPLSLSIGHEMPCNDCNHYASELANAFEKALGWSFSQPLLIAPLQKSPKGVALVVPDQTKLSQGVLQIAKALRDAEIEFDIFNQRSPEPRGFGEDLQLNVTPRVVWP